MLTAGRPAPSRQSSRGFTVLELVVTVTLLGLLLALALPSFAAWSRNARARTTADALQTGMRLAQAEAVPQPAGHGERKGRGHRGYSGF